MEEREDSEMLFEKAMFIAFIPWACLALVKPQEISLEEELHIPAPSALPQI